MAYHYTTRLHLKTAPSSLGVRLGRLAVRRQLSVQDITKRIGASRPTVYSWFAGGTVSNAYKDRVLALITELKIKKT